MATGCGGQARHAEPVRREAPVAPSAPLIAYEAPSLATDVSYEKVCTSGAASTSGDDQPRAFEFDPIPLHALPFGPRIAEMPRRGPRRSSRELRDAVGRQVAHMNACYRWARHVDRIEGVEVDAGLTIDPFGRVSQVEVSGSTRLDECVHEGLSAMQVDGPTPRVTKAKLRIAFVPSGLDLASKAPPRPKAPAPPPVSSCIQQPKPLPVDELVVEQTLVTFDDWSRDQEIATFRRTHPGRPLPPAQRPGCTTHSFAAMPQDFERALRSNLGAFRQCYARALQSAPGLTGEVRAAVRFGMTGLAEQVDLAAPNQALTACLRAAFEELAVRPLPPEPTRVSYAFRLTPTIPLASSSTDPLERGRHRLELLDAEGALASFAQAVRESGGGERECWGRLGVLQATLAKAPWVDDARVRSATEDFVRHLEHARDPAALGSCVAAAAPIVVEVAAWPFRPVSPGGLRHASIGRWQSSTLSEGAKDEAVERSKRLLALSPRVPGRSLLLELVASRVQSKRGSSAATLRPFQPCETPQSARPHPASSDPAAPRASRAACDADAPVIYREVHRRGMGAVRSEAVLTVRSSGAWVLEGAVAARRGCLPKVSLQRFRKAVSAATFTTPPPRAICDAVSTRFTTYHDVVGGRTAHASSPCGATPHPDVRKLASQMQHHVGRIDLPDPDG